MSYFSPYKKYRKPMVATLDIRRFVFDNLFEEVVGRRSKHVENQYIECYKLNRSGLNEYCYSLKGQHTENP